MKYDVCVFGGCSLDLTYFMKENETYSDIPDVITPGGKGANQAVAASRAGAKTTIITRLGNDENGQKIIQNLIKNNVDTSNIDIVDGVLNDICKIYIDKKQDNDIVRVNGAIDSFYPEMVEENKEVLLNSKIIISQLKMPKNVVAKLIDFCYNNKLTLILTPCRPEKLNISEPGNMELINKINYITLNESEFETIFSLKDVETTLKTNPNKLFITLSKDGMIYFNGEKLIKHDVVFVPNVVDRTGAGDTFTGNFAAALANNSPIDKAVSLAMYAAAFKVQTATAQAGMPTKEQLIEFMNMKRDTNNEQL